MTTAAAEMSPEERVVASIRALRAWRDLSTDEVRQAVRMPKSTWYDRMRTGQFTVSELVALANFFGVSVQALIDGKLTVAEVGAKLKLLIGGGRDPIPRTPLANALPTLPFTTRN